MSNFLLFLCENLSIHRFVVRLSQSPEYMWPTRKRKGKIHGGLYYLEQPKKPVSLTASPRLL